MYRGWGTLTLMKLIKVRLGATVGDSESCDLRIWWRACLSLVGSCIFWGYVKLNDVQVASMLRINALVYLSTWTRQLHPEDGANS